MTEHIKPCIVCGSESTFCEKYYENHINDCLTVYRIVCCDCDTMFGSLWFEDSREETINWFNNLPRKD